MGGTNFAAKSVIGDETAWSCGGGGFSDEFSQPAWQSDHVAQYFKSAKSLPDARLFNATGRGYPDLAALGGQTNPYCISFYGGKNVGGVAGTSASCPVVAGIFAQLNDKRFAAGKPSLGFLNPFLYGTAAPAGCFNDVADDSQNNCVEGTDGFLTAAGWDPATGLGTPIYDCLAKLV